MDTAPCCSLRRSPIVLLTLLYLLLPNLLFLLGWVRPVAAAPMCALLVAVVCYVWRSSGKSCLPCSSKVLFTRKDLLCLVLALLLLLCVTDLCGFLGHVKQSADFVVRNAIYETLIQSDWPIYCNGEYFVYYHSFWLPPAALAKLCGGVVHADVILFIWVYIGLALATCLLFTRLKGRVLFYIAFLLLLGNWTGDIVGVYRSLLGMKYEHPELLPLLRGMEYLGCGTQMRYFHFWGQFVWTFNSLVPCFVMVALFISRCMPLPLLPVPAALMVSASPIAAVGLVPLFVFSFLSHRRDILPALRHPASWLCCILLVVVAVYLTCQTSAGMRWLWDDSEYLIREPEPFRHVEGRLLCYAFIFSGLLIPMLLLLKKRVFCSVYGRCVVVLGLVLPLIWIGRANNELPMKGSLVLFMLLAWVYMVQYRISSRARKVWILVFLLGSSLHIGSDIQYRKLYRYTWNPEEMKENKADRWAGTLNHPDEYEYGNFFGENKYPAVFYSQPGAAMQSVLRPLAVESKPEE